MNPNIIALRGRSAAAESYAAVQRAKRKYPGATRFEVDHRGPVPVARPVRSTRGGARGRLSDQSPRVRAQQQQLKERLAQVAMTF